MRNGQKSNYSIYLRRHVRPDMNVYPDIIS